MKKWISLMLCIVMVLTLLPAAIAEESSEDIDVIESEEEIDAIDETEDEDDADRFFEPDPERPDDGDDSSWLPVEFRPIEDGDFDENPEGTINIDAKTFPDANFRKWIMKNISGGQSTMMQKTADEVIKIDCNSSSISNLKGIAVFKNLEKLCCKNNKISSLDLSKNTKLIELDCTNNKLTKLALGGCKNLEKLDCTGNSIKTLNVTANKKLKQLYVSNNKLTSLVTDGVTSLEIVYASNNALKTMGNLKNNKNLRTLTLSNNKLTTIDVANLAKLEILFVASNSLAKVDLSKNVKLEKLNISSNSLKEIDLTKNVNLVVLDVAKNSLEKIDLTKNPDLEELTLSSNKISKLDLSQNGNLILLVSRKTKLTALDLSSNGALVNLDLNGNSLTKLDLSNNTALETLDVDGNDLKVLDLSNNKYLTHVTAYKNRLGKLDLTNLSDLRELNCAANDLQTLDITPCSSLEKIDCCDNDIEALDIDVCTTLREVYCQNNRLFGLDPTPCADLEKIDCSNNFLPALHLESNAKLTSAKFSPQVVVDELNISEVGGEYQYDLNTILPTSSDTTYVKVDNTVYNYDPSTGIMIMPGQIVAGFPYAFVTGAGDMKVEVKRSFNADYTVAFKSGEVSYKGSTAYVIYDGQLHRPKFTVKDADGKTIDDCYYTYTYTTEPMYSGSLEVQMIGHTDTRTLVFKIYFGPSDWLTVENVSGGIQIKWGAIPDAGGYVVYRRAWSSTTLGWTSFARWNNTTSTSFTDTKVYAGTRYQYGVKAYCKTGTDPVSGASVGGAMDNYNLGQVSPLKTTVRITTRSITGVTPGSKKLTVTWGKSSVFTGYQVQVSTDPSFKTGKDIDNKTVKIDEWNVGKTTISNLIGDKMYYIRVRSYHVFDGTTYYGEWSTVWSQKTNK